MVSNNASELLKETAVGIVQSPIMWREFLHTAAHNHKYSFVDQLMIFAQKPQATAFASVEVWNKKLGRIVTDNATPIYLVDSSGTSGTTVHRLR